MEKPRVLVVEDDSLVRVVTAAALEDAGYEAVEIASADDALRMLEVDPVFEAVVTDINMPGNSDGLALAQRVRDTWPAVGVIVTSGNRPAAGLMPQGVHFLQKPFPLELLTRLLSDLHRPL